MSDKDASEINDSAYVAGNGLLDRRLLLKSGLSFAVAGISSTASSASADSASDARPEWMQKPGDAFSNYGKPSSYEEEVVRYPAANSQVDGNGSSWTPLHAMEGMITPNGLHFERHHNGVPQIDPAEHQLLLHGMLDQPSFFTIDDLLRYPMRSQICFLECGGNSNAGFNKRPIGASVGYFHGLASCAEWTGVPLSVVLDEVGVDKKASWLIAEGADAFAMNISIPMEKARDDAILALYQNGERLRPENGYPLRLILPGWEGVMNVKWLRRLTATDGPVMARNETARYTELLPSGKANMFSTVIEAKSLITSPSSGMHMGEPGLYQISGLAWSGRGKVSRVEVSADGGKSWADAALDEPVLSKSFTRFRLPWQWKGTESVLKSRVTDESGYRQPERQELIRKKGRHGFFHYNAIVSWLVASDGEVTHTYDEQKNTESKLPDLDADWD
ncbi:MAG: sulfite dehydrogenase [Gammaproteobacteria bacterium]|nr:sulfite dehydrogenase [Gammaproteobacteria bacterium]